MTNLEQDIIKGMWDVIKFDFTQSLPADRSDDIDAINGDAKSMSEAFESHYLLPREKAEKLTRQLAKRYDRIPNHVDFQIKAGQFWSACTSKDLSRAGTSRSALVTIVAKRYRLPREIAWRQVNAFMAALR